MNLNITNDKNGLHLKDNDINEELRDKTLPFQRRKGRYYRPNIQISKT